MDFVCKGLDEFVGRVDSIQEQSISAFEESLCEMLKSVQSDSSEEFQKNLIAQFLRTNFDYECNVRGRADLAIYDEGIAKVLFEVKSTQNKAEFVKSPNLSSLRGSEANAAIHNQNIDCHESLRDSRNDAWSLESKAFYESILYFLREFHQKKNNNIKHIILCTAREFYIIKAQTYHALFIANADKAIQKAIDTAYKNCDLNQGNDTSTGKFYAEIESILREMSSTLEFCYVNVADIIKNSAENTRDLSLFYALLSQNSLLQIPRYIDANTLNEKFYKELLYLLGLQQIETNGKVLLKPDSTPNTLLDSLQSTFADKLPSDIDEAFESHIFPLLMLWNNRILFLRLLESMLLNFKHIEKPFLHIEVLSDFSALSTLFFKVLAVKEREVIPQNLANIPYLNSSLFEKSALESQGFEIALLESKPLKIAPDSILRRDSAQNAIYKSVNELPFLEYLFTFLHAYNFTTTPKDIVDFTKTNHDKLINSAVLGLVFEKLNGYKEGSFFTPSFITSYMCAQSIRKVVVQKFNEANPHWNAKNLADIEYEIHREIRNARNTIPCHTERSEVSQNKDRDISVSAKPQYDNTKNTRESIIAKHNHTFLSIRICDPAVGSGHFLVSALNELIAIKHELGLLLDCDGKRLRDIDLALENDELIIKDSSGKIIDYTIPAHERIESHIIQKAIFYTKREIIEHCLFGVDINPSSVEICKLRLWIELLKYSYYENIATREIQTLPNIDINIKCGNSLISNIALDITKDKLKKQLKDLLQSAGLFTTTDKVENDKKQTLVFSDEIKAILNDLERKLPKQIEIYKEATNAYKNETHKDLKAQHKRNIESAKDFILNLFVKTHPTYREFKILFAEYLKTYGYNGIDNARIPNIDITELQEWQDKLNTYLHNFNFYKTLDIPKADDPRGFVERDFIALVKSMDAYENIANQAKLYFEWRFEFPEVLDENGDFMGFDLIIGNPPYGNLNKKENKDFIEAKYPNSYFGEISSNFAEMAHNLIKNRAHFGFVTSYALTFSLAQSGLRNLLHSNYKNIQISSYDRDGFPQFEKMSQSVCILFADSKGANQRAIFQTSNFVRQKITHDELEFNQIDNLLLIGDELGNDFSQRHRIPKIGGEANLKLLKQMQKMPNKLGNLFDGNESLYIRTSGNYWYNAFLEIPYQSTEIKSFSVKNKYFVFCLINSNIYYWWLRIYGDGRHNNKDIMDSFRLPKMDLIEKHNDLWEKLALNHWAKMKSVFNTKNKFFATSKIKDCVDILDYHICLKILRFDKKTLKYICNYDKNIRGGLKCNFRKLEAGLKDK